MLHPGPDESVPLTIGLRPKRAVGLHSPGCRPGNRTCPRVFEGQRSVNLLRAIQANGRAVGPFMRRRIQSQTFSLGYANCWTFGPKRIRSRILMFLRRLKLSPHSSKLDDLVRPRVNRGQYRNWGVQLKWAVYLCISRPGR